MTPAGPTGRVHRDRGARGFTLLELLVALTLLGLLMAALMGGLRLGARAWEVSQRELEQTSRLQTVQAFLRSRLAGAAPLAVAKPDGNYEPAFLGRADALRFATLLPTQIGPGYHLMTLEVANERDQQDLILRWQPFAPTGGAEADEAPSERVLLERIAGLEVAYYGVAAIGEARAWFDAWTVLDAMPELVRIEVAFAPEDPRIWPPLIVAPRLAPFYPEAF